MFLEDIREYEDLQKIIHESEMQSMNATAAMIRLEHDAIMTNNMELLNEGLGEFFEAIVEGFKKVINAIISFFSNLMESIGDFLFGKSEKLTKEDLDTYKDQIKFINDDFSLYEEQIKNIISKNYKICRINYLDRSCKNRLRDRVKEYSTPSVKIYSNIDTIISNLKIGILRKAATAVGLASDDTLLKQSEMYEKELDTQIQIFDERTKKSIKDVVLDIYGSHKLYTDENAIARTVYKQLDAVVTSTSLEGDKEVLNSLLKTKALIKQYEETIKIIDKNGNSQINSLKDGYKDNAKRTMWASKTLNQAKKGISSLIKINSYIVKIYNEYLQLDLRWRAQWVHAINRISEKK
jgi:hypothetical protein